jgi:hypothetical protein
VLPGLGSRSPFNLLLIGLANTHCRQERGFLFLFTENMGIVRCFEMQLRRTRVFNSGQDCKLVVYTSCRNFLTSSLPSNCNFGGLNRRKCDCIRRILKSDRATGNARPVISFARLQPLMRHCARSSPAHCPPLNLPSSAIRHPPSARGSDGTTAAKPHYHPAALESIYSRSSLAAATLQATKILTQPSWRSGGAPAVTPHRLHYPRLHHRSRAATSPSSWTPRRTRTPRQRKRKATWARPRLVVARPARIRFPHGERLRMGPVFSAERSNVLFGIVSSSRLNTFRPTRAVPHHAFFFLYIAHRPQPRAPAAGSMCCERMKRWVSTED